MDTVYGRAQLFDCDELRSEIYNIQLNTVDMANLVLASNNGYQLMFHLFTAVDIADLLFAGEKIECFNTSCSIEKLERLMPFVLSICISLYAYVHSSDVRQDNNNNDIIIVEVTSHMYVTKMYRLLKL